VEQLSEGGTQWRPVQLSDQFCPGARIRVGGSSRVSLILHNETLLRLAEYSSVHLGWQENDGGTWLDLIQGIAHFISRVRNGFEVNTPFMNAGIEGTEFIVESTGNGAAVTVLEGRIRAHNPWGEIHLKDGQKAVAREGEAPRLEQLVDPVDAVQWTLHYPPLYEVGTGAGRKAVEAYDRGDIEAAFAALAQGTGIDQNPTALVQRATLYLQVGKVDSAMGDLKAALHLDASQADALALMSIIATVQNRRQHALELAQQAVDIDPRGLSPMLALSYAWQARSKLPEALEATRQATEFNPDSALAWSQRARLHLMFRELGEASRSARRAVAIAPESTQALTTLGFIHLIRLELDQARQAFEQAVRFDRSAAPLTRLGLGLLEIREGNMAEGRQQLEIAANLNPGNAMIRSYLGKAYYEEVRDIEASTQFDLAKQFDELDPTPWFYNAILLRSENRPVDALNELQTAIELNDNRAVYRSRFLLDQDEAVRNVAQARVYHDLGFKELAEVEAYKSLQTTAHNYAAHRLLADSYSCGSGRARARMSELLQSQLLQPLSSLSIQSQLSANTLNNFDCRTSGFSEYSSLFMRNDLNLQISAVGGSDNTVGNDLILSGLHNRIALGLGQAHYQADLGLGEGESERDSYDAFMQIDLTPSTSVQLEYIQADIEEDHPFSYVDNESIEWNVSEKEDSRQHLNRFGLHHQFNGDGHLVASLIDYKWKSAIKSLSSYYDPNYPTSDGGDQPAIVEFLETSSFDGDSRTMELQFVQTFRDHKFILGLTHHVDDATDDLISQSIVNFLTQSPPYVHTYPYPKEQLGQDVLDANFGNLYLYSQIALPAKVNLTLGVAREHFELAMLETDQTSPKFGLTWEVLDGLDFRAAYLEKIAQPLYMDQGIEPTQVAGFNQVHDILEGSEIEQFGFGVDVNLNRTVGLGVEYNRIDTALAQYGLNLSEDYYTSSDRELTRAYLHWIATSKLAIHFSYEKYDFTHRANLFEDASTTQLTDLGLRYHWRSGISFRLRGVHVEHENSPCCSEVEQEKLWRVDALVGYRLPKHYGKVELIANNLLNKKAEFDDFHDQSEPNPLSQIPPERQLFVYFTLEF
jgi:tetratricopeptide (TPR) repeat protein